MVGVVFLPFESCTDSPVGPSSFGAWVRHLRPRTGRVEIDEPASKLEKIYIALYATDGSEMRFFDVQSAPPKLGIPRSTGDLYGADELPRRSLSYGEFINEVYLAYQRRNHSEFRWDDGDVEILQPSGQPDDEDEDDDDDEA